MRAVGVSHRRTFAVIAFAGVAMILVSALPMRARSATAESSPATSGAATARGSTPLTAAAPVAAKTPAARPSPADSADSKETGLPAGGRSGAAPDSQKVPDTTQIIPRAAPVPPPDFSSDYSPPVATPSPADEDFEAQGSTTGNQIASYEHHQFQGLNQQGFGMPGQFVGQGTARSSIGIVVAEARRQMSDGQEAQGLLILDVKKGSPAAKAGLRAYHQAAQAALTVGTVAAAMVFPPAILALPVIDYTGVGQSYDMIIGVDGIRVTNFMDFEDQVGKAKPGEIVYLTIIRNGRRLQITVPIPSVTRTASR